MGILSAQTHGVCRIYAIGTKMSVPSLLKISIAQKRIPGNQKSSDTKEDTEYRNPISSIMFITDCPRRLALIEVR